MLCVHAWDNHKIGIILVLEKQLKTACKYKLHVSYLEGKFLAEILILNYSVPLNMGLDMKKYKGRLETINCKSA